MLCRAQIEGYINQKLKIYFDNCNVLLMDNLFESTKSQGNVELADTHQDFSEPLQLSMLARKYISNGYATTKIIVDRLSIKRKIF